jgi:predicted TIM-barrel fold metal-dependent hydrolase
MVVDFHTHIFPDFLAQRAIEALVTKSGNIFPTVHDGSLSGLLGRMCEWGIDVSVVMPIITKPSQTIEVNEWARSICSDRVIAFGGVHPHTDDYKRDIDFAIGLGLKGLKFHCEYQDFVVDDLNMLEIYDYALSKGLIIMHHAGFDPGYPPPYKSSPKQFSKIADAMRGGVIIAAHLGGEGQWGDVEEFLAGSGIYLDTSMGFDFYSQEQFMRIVKKHGADKILFASDSPWSNAKTEIEHLRKMPLEGRAADAILGGNAMRLLGLQ